MKNLFRRKKLYKKAVRNVSFEIEKGELVGFLGPNGAGKTTTLKMLSGILTPDSGNANVMRYTPWEREEKYKKQFAMVMGQKEQLWWDLPPMESFILNKKIYEVEEKRFKKNLNEMVKLLEVKNIINKQVRKLSLGERMKCELIAALLHDPKVIFLDEPTIGLDVVAQKNIRDFLKEYNREKKATIILTSHYMEDIIQLCPRIVIIDLGKIIYDGLMSDLTKKYAPNRMITVYLENEVSKGEALKLGKVYKFKPFKISYKVPRRKTKDLAGKILSSDLPVKDIDISEVDIDSIIRNIFSK